MKDPKQLEDKLARKIMQIAPIEEPSKDFAHKIIRQLHSESNISHVVSRPLIPTPILTIGVGFIILTTIVAYFKLNTTSGWFENNLVDKLNFSIFHDVFPTIGGSTILIYAIVLFLIVFLIQVNFLKEYHNRSFSSLSS